MMIKVIETTDKKNLGLVVELTESIELDSDFVFKDYKTKIDGDNVIIYNENYIIKGTKL